MQTTVMDQFISKNVALDTGLIMNAFGSDTNLVNKFQRAIKKVYLNCLTMDGIM